MPAPFQQGGKTVSAKENWKKLSKILDEADAYDRAIGKLNFDLECTAPEEGMDQTGEDMAVLGRRLFSLLHSKRFTGLLTALKNDPEGLSDRQKRAVELLWRSHEKEKNISPAFAYRMSLAETRAYTAWLKAKKASDFSRFAPAFEKIVDFSRKAVLLRDKKYPTVYDALLDDYEPGGSALQLDGFFSSLKERILPLIKRICEEGRPIRTDFLTRPVPSRSKSRRNSPARSSTLRGSAVRLWCCRRPSIPSPTITDRTTSGSRPTTTKRTSSPISSRRCTRADTPCLCRTSRRSTTPTTSRTK